MSASTQAAYSARLLLMNFLAGIPITVHYQWRDEANTDAGDKFGLLDYNYAPRPAYGVVRNLMAQLNGYIYRGRVGAAGADYTLLFQHFQSGALKIAAWTTGKTHTITLKPKKPKKPLVLKNISAVPQYIPIAADAL